MSRCLAIDQSRMVALRIVRAVSVCLRCHLFKELSVLQRENRGQDFNSVRYNCSAALDIHMYMTKG